MKRNETFKKLQRHVEILAGKLDKEKRKQNKLLQSRGNKEEDAVRSIKNNCIRLQRKYKRKSADYERIFVRKRKKLHRMFEEKLLLY